MPFEIESQHFAGALKVIVPRVFPDERGFFMETYRHDQFTTLGIPDVFVQDNHSRSTQGVLRGLHFQWDAPLAKLMRVTVGSVFLVAVDIRKNSPSLGEWFGLEVSAENKRQVFAPPGFARGFCVTSDVAELQYKCTAHYNPKGEGGILWNDPHIGIEWPTTTPILSPKDTIAWTLEAWLALDYANTFTYP